MAFVGEKKVTSARKRHRCSWCNEVIEVGEVMKREGVPVKIVQIVAMSFPASANNGDCHKLVALDADGRLWEQWHSLGYANVPTDGEWMLIPCPVK